MARLLIGLLLGGICAVGPLLHAQSAALEFVVSAPPDDTVRTATIAVDGQQRLLQFDRQHPQTLVTLAARPRGTRVRIEVRIEIGASRLEGQSWRTELTLNGSDHVEYTILEDGRGQVNQWPVVTWLSGAGRMDVTLNSATIGSTRLQKGVAPARRHVSEWKSGGRAVCRHEFALEPNVERTFSCDPNTGRVIEVQ